jgi:hypothetical protein
MKVFISWSGEYARAVAELLKTHIESVNQRVQVFVSSQSIKAGSVWFDVIMGELDETGYGIVCVTKSHKDRPWLLFEAGAMASKFRLEGVVPLLIDASNADLTNSPLVNFNAISIGRDSIAEIHSLINERMADSPLGSLENSRLMKSFESDWPDFEANIAGIVPPGPPESSPSKMKQPDPMDEVLGLVRKIDRALRNPPSTDAEMIQRISEMDAMGEDITSKDITNSLQAEYFVTRNAVKNALNRYIDMRSRVKPTD